MSDKKYADIIIPVALEGSFTYDLSEVKNTRLFVGSRVIVSFGKSRLLIGVISKLHSQKPDYPVIKKVSGVPDVGPRISELQLNFWKWMSGYYICTIGEVMDAAMPSGLKLKSSNDDSEMNLKYSPKEVSVVKLAKDYSDAQLNEIIDGLSRSRAGKVLLLKYLEIRGFEEGNNKVVVLRDELLKSAGVSSAPLSLLMKKGILSLQRMKVDRGKESSVEVKEPMDLSREQEIAYKSVIEGFGRKKTVLLKGVTSSGKTEIYVHLIMEQLKMGKQVLYLLPEIALTSQLIDRLRSYFGDDVGVYHSRFTDNEKVEVWLRSSISTSNNPYKIILGVRSSLFLPFSNLGLIIIDEEHDSSYKQQDPAPRYFARDSAIVLAAMHGANVLLGSATPSIESVFNCREGKFALVELNTRYGNVKLPEIEIADSKEAYRRKIMISHFTPQLIRATEEALERGEQVVYFRNRRGYSNIVICKECGWVPACTDCSVSLTYHKGISKLKCHYCGKGTDVPGSCSNCGSHDISMKGFGTEKIEDEVASLFPDYKVGRMDLDTTRKKGSLDKIVRKLERKEIDILVGTQMISKGLDFENLTLVGVLNVDNMLFFPDFRASEKCFQLIEQVSGRAGRREKQGRVVLQTSDPHNSVIRQALNHDFWTMYETQISDRRDFHYPPFTRLIKIFVKHRDRNVVSENATKLASNLRKTQGIVVLGPEYPIISRIQNYFIMSILIKVERESQELKRIKQLIKLSIDHVAGEARKSGLRIYADVDPIG